MILCVDCERAPLCRQRGGSGMAERYSQGRQVAVDLSTDGVSYPNREWRFLQDVVPTGCTTALSDNRLSPRLSLLCLEPPQPKVSAIAERDRPGLWRGELQTEATWGCATSSTMAGLAAGSESVPLDGLASDIGFG